MRRRITKQQIALTIGLLTLLAAAGFWWSPHIWWAYNISRSGAKIAPVPVSPLQASGKTEGWFTCRIGALQFRAPPEIAEEAERSVAKKDKTMISLKAPSVELLIFVPFKAPEGARSPPLVEMADYLKLDPMHLIAESFGASTSDFRWTMSRAELQRHQILLNVGHLFPPYPHTRGTKVESSFEGPWEGLLIVYDRTQARFEWRLKTGPEAGLIVFVAENGLNLDEVRDICASVSCDETRLGPPRTPADVAALVDTIEMTRDKDLK